VITEAAFTGGATEEESESMRTKLTNLAVAGAAASLVLALGACGDDGGDGATGQGFEDCAENPNTCNSGDRDEGGEIVWTLDQSPDGYFPWSPEGGSVYTLQAIQGILPHTGQFQPDGAYQQNLDLLAEEPQIISEDPFQTQWRIRDEAVWNDGTPITADDVIITWKMSTPEDEGHCVGCRPRAPLTLIENIEATDGGKGYVITYKEGVRNPEWFAAFTSVHGIVGGIAPSHIATQNGWDINSPEDLGEYFKFLNDNPPEFSGGPYLIEQFDINNQVVKVPNPMWYGEEQATLDRMVIRFLTDESTWVPALQNGELNGAAPAGWAPDVVRELQNLGNVRVNIQSGPSWEHIDLNLDNEWLGADAALRQAIFTAIDQQDLATRIYGDLYPDIEPRGNHVHGNDSQYYVNHLEGTGQGSGDIEAARQILADAGYEGMDGGAGALTKDGEQVGPFRLRSTTAPARVTAQQLIQSYLAEIGVQADIEPTDDLGGTLTTQDYDIMEFGWSGSPLFFGTGQQYWETGSGSNFGNYSNPEVDALVEQEQQAASLDESAQLHDQMMEIVVADAYVLPLYSTPVYVFVTDNYVNVRDNTNSSLRALYETDDWGVAAQ
jgi:peptide/nickel transport system substrate-binding protein